MWLVSHMNYLNSFDFSVFSFVKIIFLDLTFMNENKWKYDSVGNIFVLFKCIFMKLKTKFLFLTITYSICP